MILRINASSSKQPCSTYKCLQAESCAEKVTPKPLRHTEINKKCILMRGREVILTIRTSFVIRGSKHLEIIKVLCFGG